MNLTFKKQYRVFVIYSSPVFVNKLSKIFVLIQNFFWSNHVTSELCMLEFVSIQNATSICIYSTVYIQCMYIGTCICNLCDKLFLTSCLISVACTAHAHAYTCTPEWVNVHTHPHTCGCGMTTQFLVHCLLFYIYPPPLPLPRHLHHWPEDIAVTRTIW